MRQFRSILRLFFVLATFQTLLFAETLSITDGASGFSYDSDITATDGNMDLLVGGQTMGYGEGWFLTQGGTTEELQAGTVTFASPDGTASTISFTLGDLSTEITYSITETSPAVASLSITTTVTNNGGAVISGKLTNYFDYDFQTDVDFGATTPGGPGEVTISGGHESIGVVERSYSGVDRYEIDEYDVLYESILAGMDLANTDNGFTIGDITGAAEIDFNLAPGGSAGFTSGIATTAVPEPSAFAGMLLLSAFGIGRRQR